MTTIDDICVLRRDAERCERRYNRRCRRLVALYRAGRVPEDGHWDYTDYMRMAMESSRRDLEYVIETQAQIASMDTAERSDRR